MKDPVQAQLDAYNARDVDAFLAAYAEDAVIEDARGTVLMRGRDEMRAGYAPMFDESPDLRCELVSRIRAGDYVIDEERVTGHSVGQDVHAVLVYHVAGGLIDHVRFIR